jgi:hypothetical protein
VCRLIVRVLAVLVALAALTINDASMTPTYAKGGCPRVGEDGICRSDEDHPPTPIDPPKGGRAANVSTSAGSRACRDEGNVIPCSKEGFSWISSPTGGCYGAMLDNAAADDPAWQGHSSSAGHLAYCPLDGVSQVMFFVPNGAAPQIVEAAAVAQRMLARAPFEVVDLQMAPPYGTKTYIRIANWFLLATAICEWRSGSPARESRWVKAVATKGNAHDHAQQHDRAQN